MPLNFPSNPQDGDLYENYVYDATPGVWRFNADGQTLNNQIADLEAFDNNFDLYDPADGQALVFDSTSGTWVPGNAAPSGVKELTSDNINIDFSDNIPLESRAVTGDVTFTATNYTPGAKKTVYLTGDTISRNLTFPTGWNFVTNKPDAIGTAAKNILDLNSFGNSESTTVGIWLGASSFEPIVASGGTELEILVDSVIYKVHTFTTSGILNVSQLGSAPQADILVVAGGGGSGQDLGGGGGGGGVAYAPLYSIASATSYNISVGLGGAGSTNSAPGSNGADSSFASAITTFGGGGGGSWTGARGTNGGSGGGTSAGSGAGGQPTQTSGAGYTGYGNAGGTAAGGTNAYDYAGSSGGGGAGGPGGNGNASNFGANSTTYAYGGAGLVFDISGSSVIYGAGGPGISDNGSNYGAAATGGAGVNSNGIANTGGGAGGSQSATPYTGGSGIVIFRYPITDPN